MNIDLSIILPVYDVEKYIHTCMECIFKQGLDENNFEVIIVNDGTKDNSINVISDILERHSNITIINQENQGISIARNNGFAIARGEYIIMLDSDDMLVDNSLKPLLDIALNSKVDLIVADFIQMSNEEIAKTRDFTSMQKPLPIEYQETTGQDLYINYLDFNNCAIWHILFKREFLLSNKITFLPQIWFEDLLYTPECYLRAKTCIKASWFLNIYRRRSDSISLGKFNKRKAESLCILINRNWELKKLFNYSEQYVKLKKYLVQLINILLYSISHSSLNFKERTLLLCSIKQEIKNAYSLKMDKQLLKNILIRTMPVFYTYIRNYLGKTW